ncbi:tRNA 2-thiocytidine(32) synthetase TtcA [Ignatzschineria sp. LJL83]
MLEQIKNLTTPVAVDVSSLKTKKSESLTDNKSDQLSFSKLQKKLRHQVGNAVMDYQMIEEGDRIMVCLSGGKDSYTLLDLLLTLQKHAPISFEIMAVNLDQKQPGFPEYILPAYLDSIGVNYHIIEQDTYSIVTSKIEAGKTMCSLCSRLRRGSLYTYAKEHGFNKIALGHHRDDIVETLFMNMFFGGTMKAMPPKLRSDDADNIVIRPLSYCSEADIQAYSDMKEFPIIPCNLCGSQDGLQRQEVKKLLQEWEAQTPGRIENIFRATKNIRLSQLCDTDLFDFDAFTKNSEYVKS